MAVITIGAPKCAACVVRVENHLAKRRVVAGALLGHLYVIRRDSQ